MSRSASRAAPTLVGGTLGILLAVEVGGCAEPPAGLASTPHGDGPRVVFDFHRRPLPEIPLPNNLATRVDPTSPTGRRINASLVAATELEATARRRVDEMTGWGIYQTLSVQFDGPLDLGSFFDRHRDFRRGDGTDYDFENDAVFLIDVTPDSPGYLAPVPLDFGEGNFPSLLRTPQQYWEHDLKTVTKTFLLETFNEDFNENLELDPGEDLDLDGILDLGAYHPRQDGDQSTLDPDLDITSFYERETNTLLFKPILPLREATTYAVVLTNRLEGENGDPVRSPFKYVNHAEQTEDLEPVSEALGKLGLSKDDIAFAWSFTTQAVTNDLVALRNGLYGAGPLAWLAEDNPPELTHLSQMVDEGVEGPNLFTITPEVMDPIIQPFAEAAFGDLGAVDATEIRASLLDYAYHVSGRFKSPRLLDLVEEGNPDARSWPADLADPALQDEIEYDEIQFWCSIPKPQFRGEGPVPVVLYGHGYTSNKLEAFGLALHGSSGMAVCSIDAVGHGVDVGDAATSLQALLEIYNIGPLEEALLSGRARDIDGDGLVDPGADALTAYMFRTRDTLRQTVLDWLTLVRLIRSFGDEEMIDVDGDGDEELLGDFDGDGEIDFGGPEASFFASGTSLGGLISSVLAGAEPRVTAAAPISGGAGLVDLAMRSEQGGVVEALGLRLLGPAIVGEPSADGGTRIYQLFVNENQVERRTIAVREGIEAGNVVMVTNVRTGEARCGWVMPEEPPAGFENYIGWPQATNCAPNDPEGTCRACEAATVGTYACDLASTFRVAIPSDDLDPLRIDVLSGEEAVEIDPELRQCSATAEAELEFSIETFEISGNYRDFDFEPDDELVALEDGYGFQRATTALRRFTNIGEMVVEPADPAAWAVRYSREPLSFQEGDDEPFVAPAANVLNITTIGDPNVPVNTGVAIAKVAGFIELRKVDPRYGKTPNRVLIDEGVQLGIPRLETRGSEWGPVLVDVDNLAQCNNGPMELCLDDGLVAPRLDPPLRLIDTTAGTEEGLSGIVFPMADEFNGVHGFPPPGIYDKGPFDLGHFMIQQIGTYFRSGGTRVSYDKCQADGPQGCRPGADEPRP